MFRTIMFACAASIAFADAPALAATIDFKATMSPAQEVPPPDATGTGTADAEYDTVSHKLTYTITWSGLSGPATMAHFHGPAKPGANADVAVALGVNPTSPLKGSTTLTDAQAKQLTDGLWYANVHTAKHKKGELRGQMEAVK